MIKTYLITIMFILYSSIALSAGSDGGDSKADPYKTALNHLKSGKKLEKKGKIKKAKKRYVKAFERFLKLYQVDKSNPDILNYLGFTSRKIGKFEDAEIYYKLGLEIDPKHNGINEYLGELYLSTNRPGLAKERLLVLKDCSCEEYDELKALIKGKKESKY